MFDGINLVDLVDDELLYLDDVFECAEWRSVDSIADYTARCYGDDGDDPGLVVVELESAKCYGIVGYRWASSDPSGQYEIGPPTIDRVKAVREGEKHAEQADEGIDLDDTLEAIVESGYFGESTADDIRAVCEEATKHAQGLVLVPAGRIVGPPGSKWVTSGYLDCDSYVSLSTNHDRVEYAAYALLKAVTIALDESRD
jgi:hypothetical protein